jgi:hypothetical protein
MEDKDRLENFIRQNRHSFDDLRAPAGVWARISKKDRSLHPLWKWSSIAASTMLLVTIGYVWGVQTQTKPVIAGWEEYLETEHYYQNQINLKMEEIKALPVSQEVMGDIRMLEDVYQQLRKELFENPNADTELLLSVMIKHQQQKLKVLEKIVTRVDKYKTNENDNHEM